MNRENREQIEREYLSILVQKPELIELVQIKPIELNSQIHREMFSYITNYYKDHGTVSTSDMISVKMIDYFVELVEAFLVMPETNGRIRKSNRRILQRR